MFGISDNHHIVAENIKTNIIDALNVQDIYISTYTHPLYDEMIETLKPKFAANPPNARNGFQMVKIHNLATLNAVRDSKIEYDWIIMGRLDASYEYDFTRLFEEKKMKENPNTCFHLCWCETKRHVDDMLWIFPMIHLGTVISAFEILKQRGAWTHDLRSTIEKLGVQCQHMFEGYFFLRDRRPFMKLARELIKK
jgi:hypothetical protein